MDMWLVFFWTGPIGIAAFPAGFGVLFWGIGKMSENKKIKDKLQ